MSDELEFTLRQQSNVRRHADLTEDEKTKWGRLKMRTAHYVLPILWISVYPYVTRILMLILLIGTMREAIESSKVANNSLTIPDLDVVFKLVIVGLLALLCQKLRTRSFGTLRRYYRKFFKRVPLLHLENEIRVPVFYHTAVITGILFVLFDHVALLAMVIVLSATLLFGFSTKLGGFTVGVIGYTCYLILYLIIHGFFGSQSDFAGLFLVVACALTLFRRTGAFLKPKENRLSYDAE